MKRKKHIFFIAAILMQFQVLCFSSFLCYVRLKNESVLCFANELVLLILLKHFDDFTSLAISELRR